MHQHVVAFTAWRYRRGLPGAEATLRRVAEEGIVLVSTGGADQTHPRGEATRVEGGYRVSGRKVFCSQAPVGTVMSTMFAFDDPDEGRRVLNMAVPLASDGITVLDDWDVLGMRGTGSHSIQVEVNRRLYMDEATRERNAGFEPMRAHLAALMERIAAYVRSRLRR